jgi:hypothetical protein
LSYGIATLTTFDELYNIRPVHGPLGVLTFPNPGKCNTKVISVAAAKLLTYNDCKRRQMMALLY